MSFAALCRTRPWKSTTNILSDFQNASQRLSLQLLRDFCTPASSGQGTQVASSKPRGQPLKEDPKLEEMDRMKQAAEAVTASMFPWERRQMDGAGTPLTRFERIYWLVFGGAMVFLIGTNGYRWYISKKEPEVDLETAKRKDELACELATGAVNVLQCEDMFEGLSPEDITAFVESAQQRAIEKRSKEADQYDGLSPDEINALEEKRRSETVNLHQL